MSEFERDRIILATARAMRWLIENTPRGVLSPEHVELIDSLEKFPLITEAPRR